jgi:hypothetical protein
MSSINLRLNTGQQITTDYDLSKIFVWDNRYENDTYVNNSNYNPETILAGTVMGRVTNTGYLQPCSASAVDGSQNPIGVLAQDVINLPGGSSQKCYICVSGDVMAEKLIFFFGDSLDTIVNGRRFKDRLQADTVGIKLVYRTEMTDFDN